MNFKSDHLHCKGSKNKLLITFVNVNSDLLFKMPNNFNSTTRFSDRVENYIKYRPNYPAKVINFLLQRGILNMKSVIADIGSGTGISSELFLKNGNSVIGIE